MAVRVAAVATTLAAALVVLLVDEAESAVLPVYVDPCQGLAIHAAAEGVAAASVRSHQLLLRILRRSGGRVEGLRIHDIRDEIFLGDLVIGVAGRALHLDSRPSDGLAVALLAGAPLEVAGPLWTAYGEDPAFYPEILGSPRR